VKYRFRSNEKAIITAQLSEEEKGKEIRRGMLPGVYVPDYLARRLQPSGIRIFDTGYIRDGLNYITTEWIDDLASTPITGNVIDGSYNNLSATLTLAHYTDRDDVIFNVPVEQWADNYKQIDDTLTGTVNMSVYYYDDFYTLAGESAVWTGGKFAPTNDPDPLATTHLGIDFGGLTDTYTVLSSSGSTKVTATRDYAAAGVSLTLTKNFDVFLMPMINFIGADVSYTASGDTHNELLNYFMGLNPREQKFDAGHPYYGATFSSNWSIGGTLAQYTGVWNYINFLKSQFPYRAIARDRISSVYSFSALSVSAFMNPATFPTPPSMPATGGYSAMQLAAQISAYASQTPPVGRLLAVIKQAGQYYYIWKN
jgi:hypothetical protein